MAGEVVVDVGVQFRGGAPVFQPVLTTQADDGQMVLGVEEMFAGVDQIQIPGEKGEPRAYCLEADDGLRAQAFAEITSNASITLRSVGQRRRKGGRKIGRMVGEIGENGHLIYDRRNVGIILGQRAFMPGVDFVLEGAGDLLQPLGQRDAVAEEGFHLVGSGLVKGDMNL